MDISNLKEAVQYPILNGYWRSRIAQYLIEMDEISECDLNWEYLCLQIEEIDHTTDTFRSRRRILRVLGDIKLAFFQNIEKRVYPHVKDVINDIQDTNVRDCLAWNSAHGY